MKIIEQLIIYRNCLRNSNINMQIIIRNCDIIGQFLCSHLSTEDFLLKSKTNTMGLNFVDTELVASVIKDFLTMEIE